MFLYTQREQKEGYRKCTPMKDSPSVWDRAPMTQNLEKAKVLNGFFACLHYQAKPSGIPGPRSRVKVWRKENLSWVEEDQSREYLSKTDTCRSMGPDRMHPAGADGVGWCHCEVTQESLNDSDDWDSHLKTQQISLLSLRIPRELQKSASHQPWERDR